MAESKKSTKTAPIADVAHPGKSAPADNSRSIVISRPIMKDPMMVDDEAAKTTSKTGAETKSDADKVLKPLADVPEIPESTPKTDGAEPETEATAAAPAPAEESKTNGDSPADKPETSEPKAAEPSASKIDGTTVAPVDVEAEAAKAAEHEAAIQKIVDSKKYFLPINSVEKRRSARFVALGIVLAIVLSVAWLDIALDAGLIHLGSVKALTHLFSS